MFHFDIEQFKNTKLSGAFATEFTPPPADTYKAEISNLNAYQTEGKQAHNQGVKYTTLEVIYTLEDPQGKLKALGLEKATAKQKLRLDLVDPNDIKKGLQQGTNKNLDMGRLQKALGLSDVKDWTPGMLLGKKATVKTIIEKNTNDKGDWQQAIVTEVAPYNAPVGQSASAAQGMPSRPAGR